jgi:hypothetical protein
MVTLEEQLAQAWLDHDHAAIAVVHCENDVVRALKKREVACANERHALHEIARIQTLINQGESK